MVRTHRDLPDDAGGRGVGWLSEGSLRDLRMHPSVVLCDQSHLSMVTLYRALSMFTTRLTLGRLAPGSW